MATDDTLPDYPQLFPLGDLLDNWNPDNPDPPPDWDRFNSLVRLDFGNVEDRETAVMLRNAELPFLLYNVPEQDAAVRKWTDEYMMHRFSEKRGVDKSVDNHFMYYAHRLAHNDPNYKPPTSRTTMTFAEYLIEAEKRPKEAKDPHYYIQLGSVERDARFIEEDLPYFGYNKNFFIVNPDQRRGIHCRFGMRGIIAESHYDGGRNFISMFRGAKRYVLTPPSQCKNLGMLLKPHPSARHSGVDWSDRHTPSKRYDSTPRVADARFDNAAALQVIVHAGETLYVPSYWTHFIVSLDTSFQCNCRSGQTSAGLKHVAECGFVGPTIIDPDIWTFERRIKADKIRAQVQRTPAARYSATDGGGGDTAPPSAPTQDPTLSLPPPSLPPAQRVVPGVSTPALRPGVAPNGSPNTQQRSYGPSVRSSHGAGNSRRSGADDGGADGGPSALAIGIFGALIGMGLCVFAVLIVRTASKRLGGPFQGQRRAPSLPSLRV